MSCLLGVRRHVIGSGEDANGSHCSTFMPKLRDNPVRGVLAKSSSNTSPAGRTMARGQVSHSCCLCKSNGSVVCGRVMAETLATLALLSALAMFISPIFEKGKWLASITAVLSLVAFILSPIESIHQPGGMALVIVAVMCAMIQYHINQGCHKKYFNGFGGGITFVLLLTMYPEGGLKETIQTFTFTENLLAIFESTIIGVLLAQLLHNSHSFNEKNSAGIILVFAILSIGSELLDSGDLLVVIISMLFIGFLPFLEDKISPKIGSGNGRANALAISTLIGIILIFATTYALVSGVDRIGDGDGAIAVALWLTVAVTSLGLIGMLLPLLGFDAHPRPEAWGWRFGISISPMVICLQTDLTSNILLGILLALLISISSPLVLEKGSRKAS